MYGLWSNCLKAAQAQHNPQGVKDSMKLNLTHSSQEPRCHM